MLADLAPDNEVEAINQWWTEQTSRKLKVVDVTMDERLPPPCQAHLAHTHGIDRRLSVLEERTADISQVRDSLHSIEQLLARQEHIFSDIGSIKDRLRSIETTTTNQALILARQGVKTAILWAVLSASATGLVGTIVYLLRHTSIVG